MTDSNDKPSLPVVGWREWLTLPALGVARIKAKIDTGARSSSLHAFNLVSFRRDGAEWVRFEIHPRQRNCEVSVQAEAPILEYRQVMSSGGHATLRPVILTQIELLGQAWTIELTLANRDSMGFRMLLGRQALRGRFLVHPGRSYFGGRPSKSSPRRSLPSKKSRRNPESE